MQTDPLARTRLALLGFTLALGLAGCSLNPQPLPPFTGTDTPAGASGAESDASVTLAESSDAGKSAADAARASDAGTSQPEAAIDGGLEAAPDGAATDSSSNAPVDGGALDGDI